MLICMDIETGKRILSERPQQGDEMLDSRRLPTPELALGLQSVHAERLHRAPPPPRDIDGFLARMYTYQC